MVRMSTPLRISIDACVCDATHGSLPLPSTALPCLRAHAALCFALNSAQRTFKLLPQTGEWCNQLHERHDEVLNHSRLMGTLVMSAFGRKADTPNSLADVR